MPDDNKTTMEPRKKRVKILSACGECRRKKTKCNGEQPCRSCQKSNAECIYPTAAQMDDRKNHYNTGPSRAALEAIEDRLKTIEDMLRMILQQARLPTSVREADVGYTNSNISYSSSHDGSVTADDPIANDPNINDHRLPSIHNLSAALPPAPPLPVQHLPNPLGLIRHEEPVHHLYQPLAHPMYRPVPQHPSQQHPSSNALPPQSEEEAENCLAPIRKRKR
ncbi:hypothetical protein BD560DRAFT_385190 [Blakeslea trispora]|nr:hypothetical protein BD560DRAFT_385190 [Blakeslea trispora]